MKERYEKTLRYPELVQLCSSRIDYSTLNKIRDLCEEIVQGQDSDRLVEHCLVTLFENTLTETDLIDKVLILLMSDVDFEVTLERVLWKVQTIGGARKLIKYWSDRYKNAKCWNYILSMVDETASWSVIGITVLIESFPKFNFTSQHAVKLRCLCNKAIQSGMIVQLADAIISSKKLGNMPKDITTWLMKHSSALPDPTLYKMLIRSGESHSLSHDQELGFGLHPWVVLHLVNEGKCNVDEDTDICKLLVDPYTPMANKHEYLFKLAILFDREKLGMGSSDIKFTPDCRKTIGDLLGRSADTIPILSNFNILYTHLISTLHSLLGKDLSGLVLSYTGG